MGRGRRLLAQQAVALDRRMVAVRRPLLLHPAGAVGVLERLVERQHRARPRRARCRGSARSAAGSSDRPRGSRCSRAAARRSRRGGRAPCRAEPSCAGSSAAGSTGRPWAMSLIPPWTISTCAPFAHSSRRGGDLVRALAVDAAVAELEPGCFLLRPVLPLALLVGAEAESRRAAAGRGRSRASRP